MRRLVLFALGLLVLSRLAMAAETQLQLTSSTVVRFASLEEGRKLLGTCDAFVSAMSPWERAARLGVRREVSEKEFLAFAASCALPWSQDDMNKLRQAFQAIQPRLRQLRLSLPPVILLVKTSGREEKMNFLVSYTRQHAIIIPQDNLTQPADWLRRVAGHELFHIMTRHDPALRARLYRLIDFTPCEPIELPEPLNHYKVTNSDSPLMDSYTVLPIDGKMVPAVPVLAASMIFSKLHPAKREEATTITLGNSTYLTAPPISTRTSSTANRPYLYLSQCNLMELERKDGRLSARMVKGGPVFLDKAPLSGRVGYFDHPDCQPEEILACDFEILVVDPDRPDRDADYHQARIRNHQEMMKRNPTDTQIARGERAIESSNALLRRLPAQRRVISEMRQLLAW